VADLTGRRLLISQRRIIQAELLRVQWWPAK
jgi:hypothetical protein